MILLFANWVASLSSSSSSIGLTCVSVKGKLGNLGLFLIVVATGLQNAVVAAAATTTTTTTTSTALLGRLLHPFYFPSVLFSYASIIERRRIVCGSIFFFS